MGAHVLLLALLTTFPPTAEPQATCVRTLADVYAVLDCEQRDSAATLPERPLEPLDADDDAEEVIETRPGPASRQAVEPPSEALRPGTVAAPARPLPRSSPAADATITPRDRLRTLALPRARAQLPDPADFS